MASIRKKGDLQWHVQIRKKGFPSVTKTFTTKADAEAWAAVTESEMVRGVYQDRTEAEHMTVSEVIKRFSKEYAPFHYRVRDDRKEAWRFQCDHLKEGLGKFSLATLDQKMVTTYRNDRLEVVGESTVRKELYMLSKILRFAEIELGIALPRGNPVLKIRKPSGGKSRDRRLSEEEWTRLEAECKSSRNTFLWPAVELALETSMRQGELLGLDWSRIDTKRRLAFLEITKNGDARAVPLSSRAMSVLEALPQLTVGTVLPVARLTLYSAFHAAVLRAEIKDFTFHDLRHEALSRLAERGDFSVLEMAAVSGHKTLQMLKRYTHLQAENLARKLG